MKKHNYLDMIIDPAALDQIIDIKSAINTRSAAGHDVKTYVTTASVRAMVIYGSTDERVLNKKETTTANISFLIRYRSGLADDAKIVYEGRTYDVDGVPEVLGRKRFLIIHTLYAD